jgi:hypothetical protein
MKKYLEDLMEYISIDDTENKKLSDQLSELFKIDKEKAYQILSDLDFSDYIEVTNAVNAGDRDKVNFILGKSIDESTANSYSTTPSSTTTTSTPTNTEFKAGDKAKYIGDDGKAMDVEVLGDPDAKEITKIKVGNQEKVVNKAALSKDQAVQEEIDRMLQLAGIVTLDEQKARVKDTRAKATGAVTTSTPSAIDSFAKAGVISGKNKLPKTKKSKKPGPAVGSKYNTGNKK